MISRIFNHFTDNDLYAFTMSYAGQRYDNIVEDELIIRKSFKITPEYVAELRRQVDMFADVLFTDKEAEGMAKSCYYLPRSNIEWLKTYRFDPNEVKISAQGNDLKIKIKGIFYRTTFWETPLLAVISELFYIMNGYKPDKDYIKRAQIKGTHLKKLGARYSEFGTRRRFSHEVQKNVIQALIETSGLIKEGGVLVGTSNVHFALMFGITPTGTNAHKWYQLHAGLYGVRMANKMALKVWEEVYGTYLGTALTDTYTTDEFLKTFDRHDALLYESVRQDSGRPLEYIKKILHHYIEVLNIDPLFKTILFSDSLNLESVEEIVKACASKIKCAFGIGTFLSNDILGVDALKIVIKQVAVWLKDGRRVGTCKLSDDPENKASGEESVVYHTKFEIGLVQ